MFFSIQLAGNAVNLRTGGYERRNCVEKSSKNRHFRRRLLLTVRVWLSCFIGHLLRPRLIADNSADIHVKNIEPEFAAANFGAAPRRPSDSGPLVGEINRACPGLMTICLRHLHINP